MTNNLRSAVIASLLLCSLTITAQSQHKISFGIQAGYALSRNYHTVTDIGPRGFEASSRSNLAINFVVRKPFCDKWALSLEPGYITKGYSRHFDWQSIVELHSVYINLPVLANYQICRKINLELGPELAQQVWLTYNGDHYDKKDYSPSNRYFEISGTAGARISLFKKLELGLRYNHAFSPATVSKAYSGDTTPTGILKEYNVYYQSFLRWNF